MKESEREAARINAAWARHYVDGSPPPDVGPIEPDEFREAARIARELATAKVTPGHFWCAACGANKPHEHHHVCGACDRFIGCRQPVMHCECGAEIRSFDAPDGAK